MVFCHCFGVRGMSCRRVAVLMSILNSEHVTGTLYATALTQNLKMLSVPLKVASTITVSIHQDSYNLVSHSEY